MPYAYGTVVGYSPPLSSRGGSECHDHDSEGEFPIERRREDVALFRILWDGHSTSSGSGYVEDLTGPELAACLLGKDDENRATSKIKRRRVGGGWANNGGTDPKSSTSEEMAHAIARHVHATTARRQLALEWKVECSILPCLVVVAALELRREVATRIRSELLLERLRSSRTNNLEVGKGEVRDGDGINRDGGDFGYYLRHPNQYMPGFVPPDPPKHIDSDDDASDDDGDDTELDGGRRKRRGKMRLTISELERYRARVEAEANFAPSRIAERVRLACTIAYDFAMSRGSMDDYYAECDARKERERLEREKDLAISCRGGARGGLAPPPTEVRRSSRARAVVNYAEDGAAASFACGGITNNRDGLATGGGGGGGGGAGSLLPREDASGGITALHLLKLLGMLPDEERGEGDGGEEDGDAESEKVDNDPFFDPNPCLIIDQLGRKHRYLSPASVQSAIVRGIEDQIVTPECLLDEEDMVQITSQNSRKSLDRYVTDLLCTTGDKVADLGEYEPASFARCRFAPHTFLLESDDEAGDDEKEYPVTVTPEEIEARHKAIEDRQRRREQRRIERRAEFQKRSADLERAYRSQKSFELWRFRCIHGDGYTVFPLWKDAIRELIKDMIASEGVEARVGSITFGGELQSAHAEAPTRTSMEAPLVPVAAVDITQSDEELARSLAAAAALEAIDDDNPLAKRRRTARRAVAAAAGEPVFYGGNTSMSRDQLCDTLMRLLHQASRCDLGGSLSLMNLKRVIFPENYDTSRGGVVEMRKLRLALGHLVYKLGKVGRLIVNVTGSDGICWETLNESGPLVRFVDNYNEIEIASTKLLNIEGKRNDDDCELGEPAYAADVGRIDADEVAYKLSSIGGTASESSAAAPAMDPHLKSQLESLENYICNLHRTELALRNALMKAIDKGSGSSETHGTLLQISTLAISTAADEVEGTADAEDWKYFAYAKAEENSNDNFDAIFGCADKAKWYTSTDCHALIGKVIYRPQFSPLRPSRDDDVASGSGDAQLMNEKCYWYRIVSYTPSLKIVEDATIEDGVPLSTKVAAVGSARPQDNRIVERRMRFRALPVAESDIASEGSVAAEMVTDENKDMDIKYMILTEGQARAGVEAAMLHRKIHQNKSDIGTSAKSQLYQGDNIKHQALLVGPHPFRNRYGSRVILTPQPKCGEGGKFQILYGIIAGYDVVHKNLDGGKYDHSDVKNKILVLLEDNADHMVKAKIANNKENVGMEKTSSSVAFWSTVVENFDGTFSLTDVSLITSMTSSIFCSIYTIEMHEFCEGSEAYTACSSIITYLKNQSKIGPFLEPLNYLDLGLFDYPTVVKNPMDVSTLEKNLSNGKYSYICPYNKQPGTNAGDLDDDDGTDHPVYRMLYGDFHDDLMLIFDNCMKYNGDTSWITGDAAILKKNVAKKIQQVVSKAVWRGQGQDMNITNSMKSSSGRSRRGGAGDGKKSIYVDEDSDADMYMYESEDDDEYDDPGTGKRKSRKNKIRRNSTAKPKGSSKNKLGKDDFPFMAIEQPFIVPETPHEFLSGGAFPHIKIQSNIGKFALPQELWSCRYSKEKDTGKGAKCGEEGDVTNEKETTDDDEMLLLMQLQRQEDASGTVRRSTRERHAPQNYADEVDVSSYKFANSTSSQQSPVTIAGVEYYLINSEVFLSKKASVDDSEWKDSISCNAIDEFPTIPTVCRSRLGAEGIHETIHECFYAKLYRAQPPNYFTLEGGLGKYANGSFPPYLGRVLPASSPSEGTDAIIWEIREQYLIPALRWVLRGLVSSGHLEEVDSSLSEGVLDDAQTRTYFGAGTVMPSHEYYYNQIFSPLDVLDEKEILRKRRQTAVATDDDKGSKEEVELSEYEQMRAERVARNAERLKALGLA